MEVFFDFLAGWFGGISGLLCGHPFDTVKVRLQTHNYPNTRNCIVTTYKNEKIYGFYKGMGFPIASYGLINCIYFGVYGSTLRLLGLKNKEKPTYWQIFIAGCAGGAGQLLVAVPVDLIKIKMQVQTDSKHTKYRGPIHCIRSLYAQHGITGCYKGSTTQFFRDIPSSGLYFLVYEVIVRNTSSKDGTVPTAAILFAGGMAGVISWASIIPLDVVKSRIQADDPQNPKYKGMTDCFLQCYKNEGLRVFGRGFNSMAIRAFPTNAMIFLGYNWSLEFCHKLTGKNVHQRV